MPVRASKTARPSLFRRAVALLVCRVGELLGVLERVTDCPSCGAGPWRPGVLPGMRARELGPKS